MFRFVLLGSLLFLMPALVLGQTPALPAVTANGSGEIKKQPEILRVQADLRGKGKTLPEALAQLKERRKTVQAALAGLSPIKDSIRFGDPTVVPPPRPEMDLPGMHAPGLHAPPPQPMPVIQAAPVVVVAMTVKAEWSLHGLNAEDQLIASHNLQEKVRTALLGGKKAPETVANRNGVAPPPDKPCNCGCKPEEPVFLSVARISDEERARALGEAFAKAKQAARVLAQAAGSELGVLTSLASGPALPSQVPPGLMVGEGMPFADADLFAGEMISPGHGAIIMRVSVTATFQLKPAERSGK